MLAPGGFNPRYREINPTPDGGTMAGPVPLGNIRCRPPPRPPWGLDIRFAVIPDMGKRFRPRLANHTIATNLCLSKVVRVPLLHAPVLPVGTWIAEELHSTKHLAENWYPPKRSAV